MRFRKLKNGNYLGYENEFYAFVFRRPHGKWCAMIGFGNIILDMEGYFTSYLSTLQKAKDWINGRI